MNIERLLDEEIEKEMKELEKLDVGSDKYKAAVEGITKLVDRTVEIKKSDAENDLKADTLEREHELKMQQMEEDRKDRRIKNTIQILGITIPVGVTIWGTLKTFKFEETGTICSQAGKQFISKLFKK